MTKDNAKGKDVCDNCEGFEYEETTAQGYCNDPQSDHFRHVFMFFHTACDRLHKREPNKFEPK